MIGRDVATVFGDDSPERSWWIGKPWRRVELVIRDTFYRGERVDRQWDVSATLGLRRLGWHFHGVVSRQVGADYGDVPNQ